MDGITMMLKSFGLDPEKMLEKLSPQIEEFASAFIEMREQLDRIEANQAVIARALKIELSTSGEKTNEQSGQPRNSNAAGHAAGSGDAPARNAQ